MDDFAGVLPQIGSGSLDGFAVGILASGACFLALVTPWRARRRAAADDGAGETSRPGAPESTRRARPKRAAAHAAGDPGAGARRSPRRRRGTPGDFDADESIGATAVLPAVRHGRDSDGWRADSWQALKHGSAGAPARLPGGDAERAGSADAELAEAGSPLSAQEEAVEFLKMLGVYSDGEPDEDEPALQARPEHAGSHRAPDPLSDWCRAGTRGPRHAVAEDAGHAAAEEPRHAAAGQSALAEDPHHAVAQDLQHVLAEEPRHAVAERPRHAAAAGQHVLADDVHHGAAEEPRHAVAEQLRHVLAEEPRRALAEQARRALAEEPRHAVAASAAAEGVPDDSTAVLVARPELVSSKARP